MSDSSPLLTLPPLSLYIHIPWCVQKCPYCDFNSHAVRDTLPEQEYVAALLEDLESELPGVQGRTIETIFIGGGTPSLFSAASIKAILDGVAARTPLAANAEITMEANPGTFEQEKFEGFRAAGVNRLSLGVQSFKDEQLKALGRIHSAADAVHAIKLASRIGFDSFNIDLMHGLPGQSTADALADLEQALALKPAHLSWYQLTIEPNTEFAAKPPRLPVDETLWDIQEQGQALLAAHGFDQYEVSAYSRSPQLRARHNINYWQFGDYLGIGAGAHGKVTWPEADRIERRWKQKQPKAYLDPARRLGGINLIDKDERAFEFMLNALRLTGGVPSEMLSRAGLSQDQIDPLLNSAIQKGLLENNDGIIKPSRHGLLFLNNLLEIFL